MRKGASILTWLLALAGILFFAGALQLLRIRLSRGDVYPAYSTLRADPLGGKVLFESLNDLEGIAAARNFEGLDKLASSKPGALFMLGFSRWEFSGLDQTTVQSIESYLRGGGRVVIGFHGGTDAAGPRPWSGPPSESGPKSPPSKTGKPAGKNAKESSETPFFLHPPVDLSRAWGVGLGSWGIENQKEGLARVEPANKETGNSNGLESLAWHASMFFDRLTNDWRVVYRFDSRPVVIQRSMGSGVLILCADSYPFSNEAVFKRPAPAFLAWCLGPATRVVFDETHLGVVETTGVAKLARRYRLQGFVAGALLLAALFIWKNAFPLVPARETDAGLEAGAVQGREASAGMVNLLRRAVPPDRMARVCLEEWRKQAAADSGGKSARMEEIVRRAEKSGLEPVAVYRELREAFLGRDAK